MSEEVRNPATVMPRIMVQSIAINGLMSFVFLLVILFCIGSVDEALHPPYIFPMIGIFKQATKSAGAATAMQTAITLIGMVSNTGVLASVSRLTWAFACDGGLPFSRFFAHVRPLLFIYLSFFNIRLGRPKTACTETSHLPCLCLSHPSLSN